MHATTCDAPKPNTRRLMIFRRSNESSSPIMNSSSTTPHCATGSIASVSEIVTTSSQGANVRQRAKAVGAKDHASEDETDDGG